MVINAHVNLFLPVKFGRKMQEKVQWIINISGPGAQPTQTFTSVSGLLAGIYTIVWSEGTRTLRRVIVVQ
jgi:hypothetical protein